MKKKIRKLNRILAFSMAALMSASAGFVAVQSQVFPGTVTVKAAEAVTGSCGDGLTYTLDDDELTIVGNGEIDSYSFSGNKDIRYVTLGEGVTGIGYSAFSGCENLRSIDMGSVESIGSYAFGGTALTDVVVPDTCTSLGNGAFYNCAKLKSVHMSSAVTRFPSNLFKNCKALTSINVPYSCTFIETDAFDYCDNLTKLVIPNPDANFAPFAFGYYRHDTSYSPNLTNGYWEDGEYYVYGKMQEDDFSSVKTALHNNFGHTKYLGFTVYGTSGSNLQKYCKGFNMYYTTYSIAIGDLDDPYNAYYLGEQDQKLYFDNQLAFSILTNVRETSLSFDKTSMKLAPDQTDTITATILPENATDTTLVWTSSNPKVATVENGKVTGIKAGSATIKAVTANGITKTCRVTVESTPLKNNSYAASETFAPNQPLTIMASAEGGKAPYTYAYYFKRSTNSKWNELSSGYIASDHQNFKTSAEQVYFDIKVNVKDSNNIVSTKQFKVLSCYALQNRSTLSSTNVVKNSPITIKGEAFGGLAPYKYAYYFKRASNSKWNTIGTEFGSKTTATLTPTVSEDYNVRVAVKDSRGVTLTNTYTIYGEKELENRSGISAVDVIAGKKVTATAAAAYGTAPYTYTFKFKRTTNTKWNIIGQENGTSTTASITTSAADVSYDVKVIVKDSKGATAEKNWVVNTHAALVNNSTLSASSVKAGTAVKITAIASEGISPYKYAFYFRRSGNSKWNLIGTEFGSKSTATLTPTKAAGYEISVIIKDNAGNTAYKTLNLNVT